MPYSDPDNKGWVEAVMVELQPKTVLDVGPGAGAYATIARRVGSVEVVDAVEIWEPYVAEFGLTHLYDTLHVADVREHENFDYDLVCFGDVLEHMSREDALAVYSRALAQAKHVLFSIPIIHVPQGAYAGNPHEEHVEDDWKHEEILEFFPGIKRFETFRVTGVYLADAS